MGSRAITTFSVGFALMGLTVFYFAPNSLDSVYSVLPLIGVPEDSIRKLYRYYADKFVGELSEIKEPNQENKPSELLFTAEELKKFDGSADSLGLYLAILGEVFDVSKGAQHYKPGGGYAFFSGCDASRAYITGDFSENGLIDDLSGLDDSSLLGIEDWLSFYKDEYTHVGKVIGRYYDKNGNPTKELKDVLEKIQKSHSNKWLEDNEKDVFPPCNSEWSKELGSRVWCTNKSGGVERSWTGVPRKYYKPGKDARCVCVRDFGPPSDQPDHADHADLGDLQHPNLHTYPNCPFTATSCKVDHP